jgi:hypothetical protein
LAVLIPLIPVKIPVSAVVALQFSICINHMHSKQTACTKCISHMGRLQHNAQKHVAARRRYYLAQTEFDISVTPFCCPYMLYCSSS